MPGETPRLFFDLEVSHVLKSHWLLALPLAAALAVPAAAQTTTPKKPPTTTTPAPAAPASGPVTLKWQFQKGKTFYQEMTTKTDQTINVMGQSIPQTQTQTFYFSWTPDSEKNGVWTIKQKIEGVKMEITVGGNPITFDSTKPAAAGTDNPLQNFFKQLVGSTFTLTVDPSKSKPVIAIKGRDEFLKKLKSANPQMDTLLNTILSDESLKQMADPAFSVVPDHTVKPGDTWTRTSTLNLGPIGNYQTTYTYKFDGMDSSNKDLAKISVTTTLKYTPPSAAAAGPAGALPFKITKANLTSKDSKGTLLFDMKKGRVDRSDTSLQLDGSLDIDISGTTTKVELKQTQKTTVRTSDTNYVPSTPVTSASPTEK